MYYTLENTDDYLPRYRITTKRISSDSKLLTKRNYNRITEAIVKFNSLCEQINLIGYPDLCPTNFKAMPKVPEEYVESCIGIKEIECQKIVGDNWCNKPNFGTSENKKPNYP